MLSKGRLGGKQGKNALTLLLPLSQLVGLCYVPSGTPITFTAEGRQLGAQSISMDLGNPGFLNHPRFPTQGQSFPALPCLRRNGGNTTLLVQSGAAGINTWKTVSTQILQ